MKIRIFSVLELGVFRVTIKTEDWGQGDKTLMEQLGEPQVDMGGNFDGPAPDYLAFDLPSNLVSILSDSPFQQSFDSRDTSSAVARARAEIWKTEMATRITAAITALRGLQDDFNDEEVVQV